MIAAARQGKMVVRLHTGEPSIYGAVLEQMKILEANGVPYESCPGVSACFGAAASLNLEYTLPDISQTLIITRMAGRTGVPEKESIEKLAAHNASMAIYLSSGMMEKLSRALYNGGYSKDTPAAIVYKASWPDEEKYICTVDNTADEKTMNNYYSRTIEPILTAVVDEMNRKFLSKTARSQQYKHKIAFFRDQFSLLSLTDIASVGDSLTRNEIITSNEMRQHIGMKPSTDPNADVLRNKNIAPSEYNQYSGEPNAGGTEPPIETEPPAEVLVSELE